MFLPFTEKVLLLLNLYLLLNYFLTGYQIFRFIMMKQHKYSRNNYEGQDEIS